MTMPNKTRKQMIQAWLAGGWKVSNSVAIWKNLRCYNITVREDRGDPEE